MAFKKANTFQYFYQVISFGNTLVVQIIIHRHFPYITTLTHYGLYVIAALCALDCCWSTNASKYYFQQLKPLRDITFLHIMLCCQFPFYALCQTYKKLSPFLRNSEARKSSWTKRLENCVFSFQIISVEKNNEDQVDIVLEWFCCFCLWIFPYLCVFFLRFEHRIQFVETKMFYSRQSRCFLGRQGTRAAPLQITCNWFRHTFVTLCSIRSSESFELIVSTLRKPQSENTLKKI